MCVVYKHPNMMSHFSTPQVAGAYPPYVPKNSAALLQTKVTKTALVSQSSDGATSHTIGATTDHKNFLNLDTRVLDAEAPTSTSGGIFRPADAYEGVQVFPGCTHFSRHKIYYNTKRENKYGLPTSHVLLQQESASSFFKMSMELSGGSPDLSESFMRNSLLSTFLRGLRKRFQRCTVLKYLAKRCPVGSNKRRNRKNGAVILPDSHGHSSNSTPHQRAQYLRKTDVPLKSVIFPDDGYGGNTISRLGGCKATAVPCEAREGEQVVRDFEVIKEAVNFKKTKRGCRGGKRKLEVRSASSTRSYKKQKTQIGRERDPVEQTAPSEIVIQPYLIRVTSASKQSTHGECSAAGNPPGLCYGNKTASTDSNMTQGPVSRVSTGNTTRPKPQSEPHPAPGSAPEPPSYPPQHAQTAKETIKPANAPRTGTVGDRLLARMRSNVLKDITLTRNRKESTAAGPSSATNSPPGGYISQDDYDRRSRGASRGGVHGNARVLSEAIGGGRGERMKRESEMEREIRATKEGSRTDCRISFSSDTSVNRFQYSVESSEGTGKMDQDEGKDEGKDEGEGESYCKKSMRHISDATRLRQPVNTVAKIDINPTSYDHSASDSTCTDVTESVSSLLVSEGIRATTARILNSGLALHVTYRTLRTEVWQVKSIRL